MNVIHWNTDVLAAEIRTIIADTLSKGLRIIRLEASYDEAQALQKAGLLAVHESLRIAFDGYPVFLVQAVAQRAQTEPGLSALGAVAKQAAPIALPDLTQR